MHIMGTMNCLSVKAWPISLTFHFMQAYFVDVSKDAGLSKGEGKHSTLHRSSVEGTNLSGNAMPQTSTFIKISTTFHHQ